MNSLVRRVRSTAIGIVGIALVTAPLLAIGSTSQPALAAVETIDVWWPTEGAKVSGIQPFKALLSGKSLNQYHMYWQFDGGPRHKMADNYQNYPHKEALVDLGKWPGDGSYRVRFTATTKNGKRLAQRTVTINVTQTEASRAPSTTTTTALSTTTTTMPSTTVTTAPTTTTTTPTTTTTTAPTTTTTTPQPAASVLTGATLYVDPWSPAKTQAATMRDSHPYEASLLDKIASQPTAKWFGDWNGDIFSAVDEATDTITAAGAVPVYVAYIPLRDCSGYSAGGTQSADAYRSWIRSLAKGIGSRAAAVILEPDALALLDCLSDEWRVERLSLLNDAIEILGAAGSTAVYLDAGHARWHSPEETARRLEAAGVLGARGFSLNVSNFVGTEETVAYGQKVSGLLGGTPFVVDSSRNGLGPAPDGEWCNPPGRALGLPPNTRTGKSAVDAYLWVKVPGESDGTCNGGPAAGQFWSEYAVGLAERADW